MARCETGAWRNRGDDRTILASLPQISGDRRTLVIHDTNPNEGGAPQILLPGLLRFVHYRSASADGIEPEREHSSRVSEPAPRIPWGERPSHPRRGDHETPCDHQFATGIRRWLQYPCFRCPPGPPIRTAVERRDVPGGSPAFPGSSTPRSTGARGAPPSI